MSIIERVKVTTMGKLTPLIDKKVIVKDKQTGIFSTENGQMRAVNNMCPYREGSLSEGTVGGEYIYCPPHDQKIDLNTDKVQEPDTDCVKTYQVEIQNGDVFICL